MQAQGSVRRPLGTREQAIRSKEDARDLARDASPIFPIDDNTVPFLIAHGAPDPVVPVDLARRFYAALRSAGVDAKYEARAD